MNNRPIITLFEENELKISVLYSLYAQNIPGKRAFWQRLSDEEISHAAQLGTEKNPTDVVSETKFSRAVIKHVMDFVLAETEKAQLGAVSHKSALHAALRIERSMLEKKCFDLFEPNNKTIKKVFDCLNADTEKHVQTLVEEMKKNKFSFEEV